MSIKDFLKQNNRTLYGVFSGINDYQKAPLEGCINDALGMRKAAINILGFKESNCTLLLDSSSTRDNFLSAIEETIYKATDQDSIFITHSGHGSQLPATNKKEHDGVDEVLVMYGRKGQDLWKECIIRDNELGEILYKRKNKSRIVFVLDCCHTGTGTRTLGDPFVTESTKYLVPPEYARKQIILLEKRISSSIINRNEGSVSEKNIPNLISGIFNRLLGRHHGSPSGKRVGGNFVTVNIDTDEVLYSGCLDSETSADTIVNGKPHGAMSGAFLQALYHLRGSSFSYQRLYNNMMRALLNNSGGVFKQHPQLEIDSKRLESPFLT